MPFLVWQRYTWRACIIMSVFSESDFLFANASFILMSLLLFNNLIFFIFIRFPAILLVKTIDSYLHEFNNLIFFIFIRFPAILLVKTMDSYLHEFCTRYFT